MTSRGKRKPRYGFDEIVMPRRLPRTARAAKLTMPSERGRGLGDALLGPMAPLSRRLTAPAVRALMRTPLGPNLSTAIFPQLTSESSAAQSEQGHRVRAEVLHIGSQLTYRLMETDFEAL